MAERLIGSIVEKRFDNTINENIDLFEEMMEVLKELNPNMVVLTVLLPHYYFMEKASAPFMREWKMEFLKIMEDMKKKYNIDFLDLKLEESISKNFRFYRDSCHLNFTGAMAITSIINDYLTNKYINTLSFQIS